MSLLCQKFLIFITFINNYIDIFPLGRMDIHVCTLSVGVIKKKKVFIDYKCQPFYF
jgi:hypothetical protein